MIYLALLPHHPTWALSLSLLTVWPHSGHLLKMFFFSLALSCVFEQEKQASPNTLTHTRTQKCIPLSCVCGFIQKCAAPWREGRHPNPIIQVYWTHTPGYHCKACLTHALTQSLHLFNDAIMYGCQTLHTPTHTRKIRNYNATHLRTNGLLFLALGWARKREGKKLWISCRSKVTSSLKPFFVSPRW